MSAMSEAAAAKLLLTILTHLGGANLYPARVSIVMEQHKPSQMQTKGIHYSDGRGVGNIVKDGKPVQGFSFVYQRCEAFSPSLPSVPYRGRLQYGTGLELVTPYSPLPCGLTIMRQGGVYRVEPDPSNQGQMKVVLDEAHR